MKRAVIALCMLIVISFVSATRSEVIGEHSYNVCLNECYKGAMSRSNVFIQKHHCEEDTICAECLDACFNELRKNNPEIADKMDEIEIVANTPTDCFVNTILY